MQVMGRNYCNLCQKEIGGFESNCQECKRTLKICDSENKDKRIKALRTANTALEAEVGWLETEISKAIHLLIPMDSGKWWRRADKIRCNLEDALKKT